MNEKPLIDLVERENMSLLGLMMGRILGQAVSNAKGASRVARIKGKLGVTAGQMSVTLHFDSDRITITSGLDHHCKAAVSGSLTAFLEIAVKHRAVSAFLGREVSLTGNPFFALKVLPLFYVVETKD